MVIAGNLEVQCQSFFLDNLQINELEDLVNVAYKDILPDFIPMILKMILKATKIIHVNNGIINEYKVSNEVYFNTNKLKIYFENNKDVSFIDKRYPEYFYQFFSEIDVLKNKYYSEILRICWNPEERMHLCFSGILKIDYNSIINIFLNSYTYHLREIIRMSRPYDIIPCLNILELELTFFI